MSTKRCPVRRLRMVCRASFCSGVSSRGDLGQVQPGAEMPARAGDHQHPRRRVRGELRQQPVPGGAHGLAQRVAALRPVHGGADHGALAGDQQRGVIGHAAFLLGGRTMLRRTAGGRQDGRGMAYPRRHAPGDSAMAATIASASSASASWGSGCCARRSTMPRRMSRPSASGTPPRGRGAAGRHRRRGADAGRRRRRHRGLRLPLHRRPAQGASAAGEAALGAGRARVPGEAAGGRPCRGPRLRRPGRGAGRPRRGELAPWPPRPASPSCRPGARARSASRKPWPSRSASPPGRAAGSRMRRAGSPAGRRAASPGRSSPTFLFLTRRQLGPLVLQEATVTYPAATSPRRRSPPG